MAACLVAASLFAGGWLFVHRERDLADVAQEIARPPSWDDYGEDSIAWIGDRTMIYTILAPGTGARVAMRRDLLSGQTDELPGLSMAVSMASEPPAIVPSPDGKRVALTSFPDYLATCTLGTDGYDIYPGTRKDGGFCWDMDSTRLVGLVRNSSGTSWGALGVRRISEPSGGENLPIDSTLEPKMHVSGETLSLTQSGAGGALAGGVFHVVSTPANLSLTGARARVLAVKLGAKPTLVYERSVLLPEGTSSVGATFSADGKRIAWIIRRRRKNQVHEIIRRVWKSYRVEVRYSCELWVSREDGTDLRLVALSMARKKPPEYTHVRWMRNGQEIALKHGEKLYIVPVGGL